MDDRIWLFHPEAKGHFHCPADAVDDFLAIGWERSEPPDPEVSPVVAEHLAWREQERLAAESAVAQAETTKPKSARRGDNLGG